MLTPPPPPRGSADDIGYQPEQWDRFRPGPDSRVIYVSRSAGDDDNDGSSPERAVRTLVAGEARLRHGHPDWLLLRRGDVWDESFGDWRKSGRSEAEPLVISSYGHAAERPLLRTGNDGGLNSMPSSGAPSTLDYFVVEGIHFHAHTNTGHAGVGIRLVLGGRGVLIENCMVEGYGTNVVVQGYGGPHHSFELYRSIIVDAFLANGEGHAQGLFIELAHGIRIVENVFDHNGWSESVPDADPNIFRHNIYVQANCSDVVVSGNIIASGGSHGLQLRPGGVANDNLFLRNSIGLLLGDRNQPQPEGITSEARRNVFLDGRDIDPRNPRGWGIVVEDTRSATLTDNLIANRRSGSYPIAVEIAGRAGGLGAVTLERNVVWNWGGSVAVDLSRISELTLIGNLFQDLSSERPLLVLNHGARARLRSEGNALFHGTPGFGNLIQMEGIGSIADWSRETGDTTTTTARATVPDADADVARYGQSLGGEPTYAAFLAGARGQSRQRWREEYTAAAANRYFRAALGMAENPPASRSTQLVAPHD